MNSEKPLKVLSLTIEATLDKSNQDRISTDKYEICLLEEGILYLHYFENSFIEKADIENAMKIGIEMSPSDQTKVLVEVDRYVDISIEAREFVQSKMRTLKAEAHVFPGLANRLMFNVYMMLRKNNHPLKAFSTFDKAYAWLSKV